LLFGSLALSVLTVPVAGGEAMAKPKKPKPREPGSKPGKPNQSVRNMLTGEYPDHSTKEPEESDELKAMRELDRQLFPPRKAPKSVPWATSIAVPKAGPAVSTSGLPKASNGGGGDGMSEADKKADLSWLAGLKKPDFPVRFTPSVVRYLRYYKDNARGQRLVKAWMKKSGRYRDSIVKLLRQYKMPDDLVWVALIESGFNADIHSHAGAAGLWQFMPATGRIYGLTVNRRVDERLDPERSTHAALKHLKDLYQRFGTWELAFAAYNMGYGGLLASIRKFNTNDYWKLRRLEAGLPYETALYTPKIMAMAIVANNCKVFGCDKVKRDSPSPFGDNKSDAVAVAPGVTLEDVADAVGGEPKKIAALNPHVIGSRFPPLQQSTLPRTSWTVYVPRGKGKKAAEELPKTARALNLGTHRVRWGETLSTMATAFGTSLGWLQALNDLHARESPRPGTVVFVPGGRTAKSAAEIAKKSSIVATVPRQSFSYKDRRRVFYEPVFGDSIEDVARVTGVSATEVRRWNQLGPRARLQEGMRLQLFLPKDAHPKDVLLFEDGQVEVLEVMSQAFFDHHLKPRGKKRIIHVAKAGDTLRKIAKRYGVKAWNLERINRRNRRSKLKAGDKVIVYVKKS
jgi:membrane-bound lytic murein transglycosylase D